MKKKINVDDTSIHEVNDIFDVTLGTERPSRYNELKDKLFPENKGNDAIGLENLSRHDERIKSQMEQEHKDIMAIRKGPISCDLYERIVEKYDL